MRLISFSAPRAPQASANPAKEEILAGQLAAFYARHNPAKIGTEAGLARDSMGREDELNSLLREKYGHDLTSLQFGLVRG